MKRLLLCVLVLLLGCQVTGPNAVPEIHIGTQGLVMSFVDKAPPDVLYPDRPFQIAIDFQNKGATDIASGMYVIGVEDEFVQLQTANKLGLRLRGKSLFSTEGDRTIQTHTAFTTTLPEESQSRTTTVRVTACYDYQTQASADVCIDTDPLNLRLGKKPCSVSPVGLGGGQGAPVAVTRVVPDMLLTDDKNVVRPAFDISLANVGNGQVFAKSRVQAACSGGHLSADDFNTVRVTASLGGLMLACEPDHVVLGSDTMVRCTSGGISTDMGTYSTQLQITLDYGYTLSMSKELLLKRI